MNYESTTSTIEYTDPITLEALSYYMYNPSDWRVSDKTKFSTHIQHSVKQRCIVHTRELMHSDPMLRIVLQTQFSLTGIIDQEYLAIPPIIADDDPTQSTLATLDDIHFACPDSMFLSHQDFAKLALEHLK